MVIWASGSVAGDVAGGMVRERVSDMDPWVSRWSRMSCCAMQIGVSDGMIYHHLFACRVPAAEIAI
jgi:hypothetical protein